MKHIKTYKIFENTSEDAIDVIKDICIELYDEGFTMSYETNPYPVTRKEDDTSIFRLYIRKMISEGASTTFNYNEVKEVVERIGDYLDNRLIGTQLFAYHSKVKDVDREVALDWMDVDDDRFKKSYGNIRGVEIKWRNE